MERQALSRRVLFSPLRSCYLFLAYRRQHRHGAMAFDTDGAGETNEPSKGLRFNVLGIRGPARVPMLLVAELPWRCVRSARFTRRASPRRTDGCPF